MKLIVGFVHIVKSLIIITVYVSSLQANDLNSTQNDEDYIDTLHKTLTDKVKHWSNYADDQLVDMADYLTNTENNTSVIHEDILQDNKDSVDSFFLNDKYLDQTDQSYVSIRPEGRFSSKEDEEFNLKIKAHLALSKSKKRFRLFINDLDQDNAKNVATEDEEKSAPEIGLNYFAPETYGIESKYSIGIRGIYPFVRARYSSEFHPGEWIIEPIQTFRYSVKDDFEEKTQVFLDTKVTDLSLFRCLLERGTKSRVPGMSYYGSIGIYWTPKKNNGFSLSQYFNGSTKYQHTEDPSAVPVVYQDYNGIYNYGTSLNWRKNFYREWLFFEIQPGVNFHKKYDYEPNYTIRILFDMFFGKV